MSYTPTTWETGDVITADKLNNIENGVVNAKEVAVFEFTPDGASVTTDCTPQDVANAYESGKVCLAKITRGPEDFYIPFNKYATLLVSAQSDVITYLTQELAVTKRRLEGNISQGAWTYSEETARIARN